MTKLQKISLYNIISRKIIKEENYIDFIPEYILHKNPVVKDNWFNLFIKIIAKRVKSNTLKKLRMAFDDSFKRVNNCGILERLVFSYKGETEFSFDSMSCEYTAGQDYKYEINLIRNLIIQNY